MFTSSCLIFIFTENVTKKREFYVGFALAILVQGGQFLLALFDCAVKVFMRHRV